MPKYYFGWYLWQGFVLCSRWDADANPNYECDCKVEITEEEWKGSLSVLMLKYEHLRPQKV